MVRKIKINDVVSKTLLTVVILFFSVDVAFSAVSPWCDEEGDQTYPLSFEMMARGPLLSPDIRTDKNKALQAISNAFEQQQDELVSTGQAIPNDRVLQAFRSIIKKQLGGENLTSHFRFSRDGATGNDELIWPVENTSLEFDCVDEKPTSLISKDPQKASIGYATHLIFVVLSEQLEPFDDLYAKRVSERSDEYMRFMTEGLPMWPWELAVNGWGQDYNDLFTEAPKWQWVVARPSAGLEVTWPSQKEAEVEVSVGFEPLGFVRYTDKSYKNWWGLSTLVVLGTDDNGAGLGGLIRYNNYSLGIVKREDIDDPYIFLSFDLYDKLEDTKTRVSEAKETLNQLEQAWSPQ